jgi:hypothetical protein
VALHVAPDDGIRSGKHRQTSPARSGARNWPARILEINRTVLILNPENKILKLGFIREIPKNYEIYKELRK